ncbi:MAG: hypothetical protein DCC67_07290 [Planctomycetota bacterium]|nr:MAG: hypothetical protein DCC67_07290 [Planctomycetota bacterium]
MVAAVVGGAKAQAATLQSAGQSPLAAKVRRVLDSYYLRPLNTRDDAPWSVLHWSIAYGVDATVSVDRPDGQRVTAIGWLCANYPSAGQRLAVPSEEGFALPVAPGIQGHDGQFLAMLAQSHVKEHYLFRVGHHELTVADLVEYEKRTCRPNIELTFKLIGIASYEGTDAVWKNARGEQWSVRRMLEEELRAPISRLESTCGGLHRLLAIHYAVERRQREGKPIDGPFQQAHQKTLAYQRRAWEMQNADGGFSTAFLDYRENRGDVTRRLTASGHVLEYLAYSLPKEQLADPRFERAVDYVATLLEGKEGTPWHRGAMGHALHALAIYEQRMLGGRPGERSERLAGATSVDSATGRR